MKAAQISAYGEIAAVTHIVDTQVPEKHEGQVLVEIHAMSFNPFDSIIRKGFMKDHIPLTFPTTIGGDFAGTIVETGENVFGSAGVANGGSGAAAEFAVVQTKALAPMPTHASYEIAAALPLVGSSVVQAIEEHMHLAKGQTIVIHGGAGGIGHLAIQLAKYIGARVITTVRTPDIAFARSLGADEVVDFATTDFTTICHDVDAVFDTVGGDVLAKSSSILRPGGMIVSMKGQPEHGIAQMTKTTTDHLTRVAELFDRGIIAVHIDRQYPFDEVIMAWQHQEQDRPQGKVVVTINNHS